jgi:hypothetical protein
MKFDNTSLGLLLFYTAIGLYALTFAIIYWASKRNHKHSSRN